MPTRKIADLHDYYETRCRDPEHEPASMEVRKPGVYEHECPSCGRKKVFRVLPQPRLWW